jgi:hypothetical protein
MSNFHVRHDFKPNVARDALLLLRLLSETDAEHLTAYARARDLEIGHLQTSDKVFASLQDLGLVERSHANRKKTMKLTPLGSRLAELALRDELLFAELVHLRYWWLWTPGREGGYFSWAYRAVANMLWEEAPTPVDTNRLVATVISAAEEEFGIQSVSFSSSSVLGILHWLRALRPACINAGIFHRRIACPPEAVLVALEGVQETQRHSIGFPVHLDAETRSLICRATLIDPAALDDVLTHAEQSLGLVRRDGYSGEIALLRGTYLADLLPRRSLG